MLANIDCIPCIVDDLRGALDILAADEGRKRQVMKKSLEFLAENMDLSKEPSFYITHVHRILKRVCQIPLPFEERRNMCNDLGMELAKKLEKRVRDMTGFQRFSALVRWSIAGNSLDFRTVGTGYDFDLDEQERTMETLADALEVDELAEIYEKVRSSEKILFVHDNVGEIALDKLLIHYMRDGEESEVISAVRGGPITSDATMDDAMYVKLHEAASSVILAGPDTLGISFEEMSNELKSAFSQVDLVMTKGQANYYVFSEHKDEIDCPVVILFRTKCPLVYTRFGAKDNISVAAVL